MSTSRCITYGILLWVSLKLTGDYYGYTYVVLIGLMLLGRASGDAELELYGRFWVVYQASALALTALLQQMAYRGLGEYGAQPLWLDGIINACYDLAALFAYAVLVNKNHCASNARKWITSTYLCANIAAHVAVAYLSQNALPLLPKIYDAYLYIAYYVALIGTILVRGRGELVGGDANMRNLPNHRGMAMGKD